MKLKEIALEYRPRERFSRGERLSEAELLALILRHVLTIPKIKEEKEKEQEFKKYIP